MVSDPDPDPFADPTFQLVSDPDPDPVSDPTYIFSNILYINFTFVFLPSKCVRLLILTRYTVPVSFLKEYFFDQKGIYIFNMNIFC